MGNCFVVSPFGKPNSSERAFADKVLKGLIRPALGSAMLIDDAHDLRDAAEIEIAKSASAGFSVERADESKTRFGNVMERIAVSIVNDDLVVAVLWNKNPNVYYELAIAHAAARPVVILKHVDEQVPFDILGEAYIEFDVSKFDAGDPKYLSGKIAELRETAVKAIDEFKKKRLSHKHFAFRNEHMDPLGKQHSQYIVHRQFRDFSYKDWSKSIHEARSFINFAGVSLFDLTRIDNNLFEDPVTLQSSATERKTRFLLDLLLLRILIGGINVHMMIMDEDNPGLEHMLHTGAEQFGRDIGISYSKLFLQQVRQEIEMSTSRWKAFETMVGVALERTRGFEWPEGYRKAGGVNTDPSRQGSFKLTKIKQGLLYNRLSMTDREAIITPFFFEFGRNGSGPAVYTIAGTALYDAHLKDFQYLVRANSEPPPAEQIAPPAPPRLGKSAKSEGRTGSA